MMCHSVTRGNADKAPCASESALSECLKLLLLLSASMQKGSCCTHAFPIRSGHSQASSKLGIHSLLKYLLEHEALQRPSD